MPYILVAPSLIILTLILVYPSIYNLYLSFWDWKYTNPKAAYFIGLGNYLELLSDKLFRAAVKNTLVFAGSSVALEFLLGFATALLLARFAERVRRVAGPILILPHMIAASVSGLIWRLLWTYEFGLINYLLGFLGIKPVHWLAEATPAMFSVIITEVWRNTPFVTLVLLAGLMSLPLEPYEAAKVDGASSWQAFRHITLPLLIPSITVALLFRSIFAIRVFDVVFTLTKGGPGTATLPLGILLYTSTFRFFKGGYSAALAMMILLIGMIISFFYLRLLYRRVEY